MIAERLPNRNMMTPAPPEEGWTTRITPHQGWLDWRLKQLWRYRDLISLFVWRDFVSAYKQTVLGPAWHIIPAASHNLDVHRSSEKSPKFRPTGRRRFCFTYRSRSVGDILTILPRQLTLSWETLIFSAKSIFTV